MILATERLENYQKNLRCIQEVTEELISSMKGHHCSFRQEITDEEGKFSQEKLCDLVEELLSRWDANVQDCADIDPATGARITEPYVKARRELYGLYLYLGMRCSLHQGAYAAALGKAEKEQTDFAFLLKQAKKLSRDWCVTVDPNGSRKNELIDGFDPYFGLHLYHVLSGPDITLDCNDNALTPYWESIYNRLDQLTNEGNMKRIYLQHPGSCRQAEKADKTETAEDPEEDEYDDYDPAEEEYDDYDPTEEEYDDYDPMEEEYDDYDPAYDYDLLTDDAWQYQMEQQALKDERVSFLTRVSWNFADRKEYLSACKRFTDLFEQAGPDILRNFHQELEEIIDLYLAEQKLAPLTDTEQTLDVYSRIYDGPYRQAKLYEKKL